jgi:hypothetical protein
MELTTAFKSLLPHGESLLSTMYTATLDGIKLVPAHEHTQPLFGPPDPYLTAGKSIAPAAKSLIDMGVEKIAPIELSKEVQAEVAKGWKLLDWNSIQTESNLPGFRTTRGILPQHNQVPDETPETFAAQVEWAARFLPVIDKLPYAALSYGLIEFFLLRPNLDLYKEDIEDEPERATAETIATTGVRMAVFLVIAVVTVTIFG